MATRLSLGRFVQIMTGKKPEDADDPKAKARKAAEDRRTAEALVADMRATLDRLKVRQLVAPELETSVKSWESKLQEAVKEDDVAEQQGSFSYLALVLPHQIGGIQEAVEKLLEADVGFDAKLKECEQRIGSFAAQTSGLQRSDVQALFAKDLMAAHRAQLAALKDPRDPRDRVTRIKALQALSNGVNSISNYPKEAADFERVAKEVALALYARKESVQELPRSATRTFAITQLAAYSDRFDALNKVSSADKLADAQSKLGKLLDEIRTLDVDAGPVVDKRVERLDSRLDALQNKALALPIPLAGDVTQVLADLHKRIDHAAAGRGTDGSAVQVKVGQSTVTLNANELLRGVDGGLKGLEVALSKADSTERKLLEQEGASKLASNLVAMHTQFVAFGMAPPPLDAAEMYALRCYTSQDYAVMNDQRLGNPFTDAAAEARAKMLNKICDEALAKLPAYPKAAWPVFRIERAWDQSVVDKRYKRGGTFTTGVLWSTGARGSADVNASKTNGPKFIHTIYGRSGRDVAALSHKPGEGSDDQEGAKISARKAAKRDVASGKGEVLFPATARFNVTDRTDPAGGKKLLAYSDNYQGAEPIRTRLKEV